MTERSATSDDAGGSSEDPLIPRLSFDSDDYPEADRSDAYQAIVAGPARLTPLAEPFHARIKGYVAGPVRFHFVDAVPHRFERSSLKISLDAAEYLVVQHLIEGEVEGDCDGRSVEAPEGSVYCLNMRQPSLLIEKRPTRLHFVTVNPQVAFERFGDLRALHGAVFDKAQAAAYVAYLDQVYPRLETLRRSEVRDVVGATLGELAKLFAGVAPASAEWLMERAKSHIASRLGARDLTPETVAGALGVSRSQLYGPFRDVGGVAKYIWSERLKQVHAALSSPSETRSLTVLAMDFGFSSQSHLSSLFRRVYGEAPSRLRQGRRSS